MPKDRLGLVYAVQALAQAHGVQIPIIAMTDGQSEQAEFWAARVAEVLGKPLDAMALWRVVRRVMTQNQSPKGRPPEGGSSPSGPGAAVGTRPSAR